MTQTMLGIGVGRALVDFGFDTNSWARTILPFAMNLTLIILARINRLTRKGKIAR